VFKEVFKNVTLTAQGGPVGTAAISGTMGNCGTFDAKISWKPDNATTRSLNATIYVLNELRQAVLFKYTQLKLGMLLPGYPHLAANFVSTVSPLVQQEPATEVAHERPSPEFFPNLLAPAKLAIAEVSTKDPSDDQRKHDLQNLINEFPEVFDGNCRPMIGPACHFVQKEGAAPIARGSRPVPEPLLLLLKEELQQLEDQGIIRKVTEPTDWVHPIVIVPEENRVDPALR
jgi:hypothetical protein